WSPVPVTRTGIRTATASGKNCANLETEPSLAVCDATATCCVTELPRASFLVLERARGNWAIQKEARLRLFHSHPAGRFSARTLRRREETLGRSARRQPNRQSR